MKGLAQYIEESYEVFERKVEIPVFNSTDEVRCFIHDNGQKALNGQLTLCTKFKDRYLYITMCDHDAWDISQKGLWIKFNMSSYNKQPILRFGRESARLDDMMIFTTDHFHEFRIECRNEEVDKYFGPNFIQKPNNEKQWLDAFNKVFSALKSENCVLNKVLV